MSVGGFFVCFSPYPLSSDGAYILKTETSLCGKGKPGDLLLLWPFRLNLYGLATDGMYVKYTCKLWSSVQSSLTIICCISLADFCVNYSYGS